MADGKVYCPSAHLYFPNAYTLRKQLAFPYPWTPRDAVAMPIFCHIDMGDAFVREQQYTLTLKLL